jgi:hypothetical protein
VNVTLWPKTNGFGELVTDVVVLAFSTTCVVVPELAAKLELPRKAAVIVCELTESAAVENVASPLADSVPVPNTVEPSLNSTVPVGVPAAAIPAVTFAVNVTLSPNTDGFGVEETVVVVATGLMV